MAASSSRLTRTLLRPPISALCPRAYNTTTTTSSTAPPPQRRAHIVRPPTYTGTFPRESDHDREVPRRHPRRYPSGEFQRHPKKRATGVSDTIAPKLGPGELDTIYSEELFVFRCDITATQIEAAMVAYPRLRDLGVLKADDISNLARQLHAVARLFRVRHRLQEVSAHIAMLTEDLEAERIPGHPLASVHLMSCMKDLSMFDEANAFWGWLKEQDTNHCDARVYGAAIEVFAYQGVPLPELEDMYQEALERFQTTTLPAVADATGLGVPVMLLQAVITARLFHGDWRAAYEAFDHCMRLYPALTPSRIYELFIYERPVREAYIVFLMACRAGRPPAPAVLTPLMKEVWLKTWDVRALLRLVYNFVGAGGKPESNHLNVLIAALMGSMPRADTDDARALSHTMALIRRLIDAFALLGVKITVATFNTIISLGGQFGRADLVQAGLKQLLSAGLTPNMITYRVLLNTIADLAPPPPPPATTTTTTSSSTPPTPPAADPDDIAQLTEVWGMLVDARRALGASWELQDWQAFTRAALALNQLPFVRSELEAHKFDMEPGLHRAAFDHLAAATNAPRAPRERRHPDPATPLSKTQLEAEVQMLGTIFASPRIRDFAAVPSGELFLLSPSKLPEPLDPAHEARLRRLYDALATPAREGEPETLTPTGYTLPALRWANWLAVNTLLFEAEVAERESMRGFGHEGEGGPGEKGERRGKALGGPDKARAVGYELRFWNEDRAKARIEEVVRMREKGEQGWRGAEMEVRGGLAAGVPVVPGGGAVGRGGVGGRGRVGGKIL